MKTKKTVFAKEAGVFSLVGSTWHLLVPMDFSCESHRFPQGQFTIFNQGNNVDKSKECAWVLYQQKTGKLITGNVVE